MFDNQLKDGEPLTEEQINEMLQVRLANNPDYCVEQGRNELLRYLGQRRVYFLREFIDQSNVRLEVVYAWESGINDLLQSHKLTRVTETGYPVLSKI